MSTAGQTQQINVVQNSTGTRMQANHTTQSKNQSKNQRQKVWYKFKEKKTPIPQFLRLPEDVHWIIFDHFFADVHMIDIKTTQTSTIQRRYGAQSLLFVCKALRELASKAMFRFATFDISHFKLHQKHIRENKMTTLHKIQNLALLWTPPPSPGFITVRGDDAYILRTIDHLRSIEIWLLASQHLRLGSISQPEEMSCTELHEAMLAKFEPSIHSQPKWLKRLLRDAPRHFKDVKVSLVGFFAFGRVHGGDLHAAHISWPSRSIDSTEIVKWADWARARTGLTAKMFHRLSYASHRAPWLIVGEYRVTRPDVLPRTGERAFGRKVY